jgi:hypothetical protein
MRHSLAFYFLGQNNFLFDPDDGNDMFPRKLKLTFSRISVTTVKRIVLFTVTAVRN